MRIASTFTVPSWDSTVRERVVTFWKNRGFVFDHLDGDHLQARRGSIWGNLTSFDMSRLITTLSVDVSPPNEIECVLNITTKFQKITQWNEYYWRLKLETFEAWVLREDALDEQWKEFNSRSKKAAIGWVLSGGASDPNPPPTKG